MEIKIAEASDQMKWNEYVMNHGQSSMYHRFEWGDIFSSVYKHDPLYLYAEQNGSIAGVLPLIMVNSIFFKRVLISMPYFGHGGIIADNEETANRLLATAFAFGKKNKIKHIELRQPGTTYSTVPQRTDKVLMILDLASTSEEQLTLLKPRLRSKVRSAMKSDFISRIGFDTRSFFRVYSENMRYLGSPCHSEDLFTAILKTFKEESFVITILKGEIPVAGALSLVHNGTIEIPCVSSLRHWNKYEANTWLYWSLIQYSITRGLKKFSFGRSSKESGTHEFKRRWGAISHELPYSYLCCNADVKGYTNNQSESKKRKRDLAIDIWAKLPLVMTRHLGPKILRQLPPLL